MNHRATETKPDYRDIILREIEQIPVFPAIANKILRLLNDPEASLSEIVRLAEYDSGLTTNVLRIANSAYFAAQGQVGSLQDAVVRLGTRRLSGVVLISLTGPIAGKSIAGYDLGPGQLLEHNLAVGIGVETLAAEAGRFDSTRDGFTAGLLHDLGKSVLGACAAVDVASILKTANESGCSFEEAESRVLGINHADIGALLLERWNLPDGLVNAVRHHHAPEAAQQECELLDWVHVADQLALQSGIGVGIDGLKYRPCESVVARLNLDIHALERTMCKMLEGLESLKEMVQHCSGDTAHGA